MNGIKLKDTIKLFGFKDGFGFWFRWSFTDPIKIFWWKYIVGKPLCIEHGWFMCKPDCAAKKIRGRINIIGYEKERHNQIEKESKIIEGSDTGICVYCSKEKGTKIIYDPNWDTLKRWLVCKNCNEIIKLQRELSFPLNPKRQEEIHERLLQISKDTGTPILNIEIDKNLNITGVEYDGKRN